MSISKHRDQLHYDGSSDDTEGYYRDESPEHTRVKGRSMFVVEDDLILAKRQYPQGSNTSPVLFFAFHFIVFL